MPPTYALRPVTDEDEAFLLRLYGCSRPDAELLAVSAAENFDDLVRTQFELQRRHYQTSFPDAVHEIIEIEGEPAGRIWNDWREDEVRCLDVALLPEHRSKGLGGQILEDLKAQAAQRRVVVTLSVEHWNPRARAFYERHGFAVIKSYDSHSLLEWAPVS